MRLTYLVPTFLLALVMAGCSSVEIHRSPVDEFAAGNYQYYRWRTEPLPQNTHTTDAFYKLDPIMRKEVNAQLQSRGYVLDKERAQFSVDYLFAPGLLEGAEPAQASNISHIPSATINRQVDQASVDNAIALGGVKETNNMVLQFNDIAAQQIVWRATMTKIVEDANQVDTEKMAKDLAGYLGSAMGELPKAGQ